MPRPQSVTESSQPTPLISKAGPRRHTVILFPGDYSDSKNPYGKGEDDDDDNDGESVEEMKLREQYQREEAEAEAQRQKWLENAKPKVWPTVIDPATGRSYGRGARKRAQARVWIQPGDGQVTVNDQFFTEYFGRLSDRELILQPLVVTDNCGKFDVTARVKGGGLTGQAGAIQLGVARALNAYNPDLYRPPLKFQGMLTRDARKVERKKIGHVKARKSPQWVRR